MQQHDGYIPVADGLQLYYQVLGDGPEIVVIPPACWMAADLAELATGRTLLFYDPRNRGRSSTTTHVEQISIDHDVRDLEAIRQHFGYEQISLLGWSNYSALAALYTMQHPERVERLLLVGAMGPRDTTYEDPNAADYAARVDFVGINRLNDLREAGLEASDPVSYCQEFSKIYLPMRMGNASALASMRSNPCVFPNEWLGNLFANLEPLNASLKGRNWLPRLATVTVPTLVLHGAKDMVPLASSREWVTTLPYARLITLPNVGHYPWLEEPSAFFSIADCFFAGDWPSEATNITS